MSGDEPFQTEMNHSESVDNPPHNTLTARQQLTIAQVLAAPSLEEARRRARVSKGTFYGWIKEPAFVAELARQREAVVQQAFDRLKGGMTQAVDKLLELLQAEGQVSIQLRAAQSLLDHGLKAVELQDLAQRVEELERTVANQGSRPWR